MRKKDTAGDVSIVVEIAINKLPSEIAFVQFSLKVHDKFSCNTR